MPAQNSSAEYKKVKDVFAAALEIPSENRARFLAENCADENLFLEVESLLKARDEAGEFLDNVSAAATVRSFIDRSDKFVGRKIDDYLIEKEIGRGGMGVVFLATRADFRQQAAIKLIKRGMDSDAILERFTREREILAALNHPFIARLTDGGTTEGDDLPYFVMEYVEGAPVDEYCKANNLSEKETLELFRKICEAVAFAHQKLVVHRDLKPSNILVDKEGTPKLLDFGIAKLLNATDAERTQTVQRVLTPAYASPEQMRGAAVDTTSDVYSLGKILAELLLGEDFKSLTFSTTGKQAETARGKQKLNSDLLNILATALRDDAARRYNSVEKFSEDLRRYLAGLPVSARRDTFSYRAAKFVRRNRVAVAVAGLFVFTLLIGVAATLWQWREATRERELAERRFDNLRKMSGSFITEIHGAIENLPGSLPARQMLMRRAVEQLDALAIESGDNAALQEELAQAYFNSAQLPDMLLAEKDLTLKKEIAIYQKLSAAAPENISYQEQTALGKLALGDITKVRGSIVGALELDESAVSLLEQIVEKDPENQSHLVNLAGAYQEISTLYILKGAVENATQTTRKELTAIDAIKKLNADEPALKELSDIAQIRIGIEQKMAGDYKSSVNTLQAVLAQYENARRASPNDTRVAYYLWVINRRLAEALERNGDVETASAHFQTALSIIENLSAQSPKDFGYHRNAAATHIIYGRMLASRKRFEDAAAHFRRAVEQSAPVIENDPDNAESKTDLARATGNLGNALVSIGRKAEGLNYLKSAVRTFEGNSAFLDDENPDLTRDYNEIRQWLEENSSRRRD